MAKINYSKKRALVASQHGSVSTTLRGILMKIGVLGVDLVETGTMAIEALANHIYQIVIFDYELGKGKTAQEVLEEARYHRLISHNTAVVVVSAETSNALVMGVLESQPDAYMAKPVSHRELKDRLDRVFNTKDKFVQVNQLLDNQRTADALIQLDKVLHQHPRSKLLVERLRAELLLELGNYSKAEQTYQNLLKTKSLSWMQLGLGKVYYHSQRYQDAQRMFREVINNDEHNLEAYDWLAKTLYELGEFKRAQKMLQVAISRSPHSVLRQLQLAEIARLNQDWENAEVAYEKAVSYGLNSVYKTPKAYLGLVRIMQRRLDGRGDVQVAQEDAQHTGLQALSILEQIEGEYIGDQEVTFRVNVLQGETYQRLGEEEKARAAVDQAENLYEGMGSSDQDIHMEMARAYIVTDQTKKAQQIMRRIDRDNLSAAETLELDYLKVELDEKLLADMTEEQRKQAQRQQDEISANNRGVKLFNERHYGEALELFWGVAEDPQAGLSVLLNTVQTALLLSRDSVPDELNPEEILALCFARLAAFPAKDLQKSRYPRLLQMYEKLQNRSGDNPDPVG